MGADVKVTRPVLRYHGGKWKLAPWIISHFPPHSLYVEPFCGAGSVLLRKQRVLAEVYNDLDEEVVNVFRVLRDEEKAKELVRLLQLTPFSRREFENAYSLDTDPIERARRIIVRSSMGQGGNACTRSTRSGFRSKRAGAAPPVQDWVNYPQHIKSFVERLRGVTIECRPALDVIKLYDTPGTLFYVDPPYLPETRTQNYASYRHELTAGQHGELLEVLRSIKGMCVLSGYISGLYSEALKGWAQVRAQVRAEKAAKRTECLWISPKAQQAMPLLAAMEASCP